MLIPLNPVYYSGLLVWISAYHMTSMWTIIRSKYIFIAGTKLISAFKKEAPKSLYNYSTLWNNISYRFLFWTFDRIMYALKYIGLYMFVLWMSNDRVTTTLKYIGRMLWIAQQRQYMTGLYPMIPRPERKTGWRSRLYRSANAWEKVVMPITSEK